MALTPEDFLLEDYKQKISYLTAHQGRMWTRFNFFVTIESALLGGKVLLAGGEASPLVGIAGIILSLVWYVMGAQDRFLMDFYRWQVMDASQRIKDALGILAKLSGDPSRRNAVKDQILTAAQNAATEHVGSVDKEPLTRYQVWRDSKIDGSVSRWLESRSSWRSERFSTTHLAAWIPLVALILWLGYLLVQLSTS